MLRCCCYATAGNIGRNKNEKNKQLKNEQTDFHFAYEVRLGIKLTTLHYELKQSGQAARRWACRTGTCDSMPGSADARLGHPGTGQELRSAPSATCSDSASDSVTVAVGPRIMSGSRSRPGAESETPAAVLIWASLSPSRPGTRSLMIIRSMIRRIQLEVCRYYWFRIRVGIPRRGCRQSRCLFRAKKK